MKRTSLLLAALVIGGAGCSGSAGSSLNGGDGGTDSGGGGDHDSGGGHKKDAGNDASKGKDGGGHPQGDGGSGGDGNTGGGDGNTDGDSGNPGDGSGGDGGGSVDGGGDSSTTPDGSTTPDAGSDAGHTPDGGSVPDASVFSVKNVPGLALWLRAGDVTGAAVTGKVSKWPDQSGNQNDATEGNANRQPTVVASGIHGLPTVHFARALISVSNTGDQMSVANNQSTLDWGAGDFLLEVVGDYTNTTAGSTNSTVFDGAGTFYSRQASGSSPTDPMGVGVGLYGNLWLPSPGTPTTGIAGFVDQANFISTAHTGLDDGTGRVIALQRVGTTLSIRINGAQTDMKTIGTVDVDTGNSSPVRIGASGDANQFVLEGDISEMIAVKGTIAGADLTGIESYLTTKYGL